LYDEEYYRYREQTRDFRAEADELIRLLRLEPGCRVLEVGCGGGAFLGRLEKEGCEAVGVDLLEDAVEAARKMVGGSVVLRADAVALPFDDSSFDRLASHHLVEHLADLPFALSEWRRVLAPGGRMAICTPNRLYPNPSIFDDPGHRHIYDPGELAGVVEAASFEVAESMTIFPGLWKDRISVAVGVPLYPVFSRLPYYRGRGRSILLSAWKR
jgi:ubiquinone/menaquinone biosynthesis C-methylase UbiE